MRILDPKSLLPPLASDGENQLERQARTRTSLGSAGDIALWGEQLLVVRAGAIVGLAANEDSLTVKYVLSGWTIGRHQDHFGKKLHVAGDAGTLLVADSERHRVLVFHDATRAPSAQHGTTDLPGAGTHELNCPAGVAICGDRALIVDAGNQRLLKCMLKGRAPRDGSGE